MPTEGDIELARMLVANGLISQMQAEEAINFMAKLEAAGVKPSLKDVLVRKGVLSPTLDLEMLLGPMPKSDPASGVSAEELKSGIEDETPSNLKPVSASKPAPKKQDEEEVVELDSEDLIVMEDETSGVHEIGEEDYDTWESGARAPGEYPAVRPAAAPELDEEPPEAPPKAAHPPKAAKPPAKRFAPPDALPGQAPPPPQQPPAAQKKTAPGKQWGGGDEDVLDLSALSELNDRLARGDRMEAGSSLGEITQTVRMPAPDHDENEDSTLGTDPVKAFEEEISRSGLNLAVDLGDAETEEEPPKPSLSGPARDLGRYKIGRVLRKGVFGSIHEGLDTQSNQPVNIEIFKIADISWTAIVLETLFAEALSATATGHRSVLKVLDTNAKGEEGFIVTEAFEGKPLDEWVEINGAISPENMVGFLYKTLSALAAAERKNVIHYDLQPRHILIAPDYSVKVANLGLVQPRRLDGPILESGMTPLIRAMFTAPEVCEGGPMNGCSSVYALGVTSYFAATGRYPIASESPLSTALRQTTAQIVPPEERSKKIPEALSHIILKMLRRDPERRYKSFRQVIDDVELLQAKRNLAHARRSEFRPSELGADELQPVFCIIKGRNRGVAFTIARGDDMTIGRDSNRSKLPILDGMVSRAHSQIRNENGKFTVMDMGSSNGTYLNGQQITMARTFHPGDRVRLGSTEVFFGYAPTSPDPYHMATLATRKGVVTTSQAEEAILHCGNSMARGEPASVSKLLNIAGRADDEKLTELFSAMDEQILVHDMIVREMREQQASLLQAEVTETVLHADTRIMRSLLDEFHFCESCGSVILAEHLEMGVAERVNNLPFCQACAIESTFLGQKVGDVTFVQTIGSGRLGFVYKGTGDEALGQSVLAAKVFHHRLLESEEFVARLRAAYDAAIQLNHPGIIRIYDLCEVGNTLALTMDYGDRFSLQVRLYSGLGEVKRQLQPLAIQDSMHIAHEIAKSLDYAHKQGVAHGELWPGKVYVSPRGIVKVGGFGMRADDILAGIAQQTDSRMTPYQAPERKKAHAPDEKMDQFSLGSILYTMLLGKLCNPQTAERDVLNEGVVLPKQLTTLLAAMLAADPASRLPGIQDCIAEMESLIQKQAGAAS
ncbi:MAG TPA: protein kinase [Candidatus Brocadiia bacterium]|nr:protein kinase [Candidatus Brocadiia bacterium]